MSWDNNCVDCEKAIGDDYERCFECNDTYTNEELPIEYSEIVNAHLPKSWVFTIKGKEVQLPHSECTLDEEKTKIWVPRWLAEKEEID